MSLPPKDYRSISPSAKALLWMKALTDIPFARETAVLVFGADNLPTETNERVNEAFLKRLAHFESRYRSIDAGLAMLGIPNILELASGYSFRGLQKALWDDVYYLDTDLPETIDTKEQILPALLRSLEARPIGHFQRLGLNAVRAGAGAVQNRFPPGPVVCVNEGLLVYLDEAEKRACCAFVRDLIQNRGGYWVTGDVYVRGPGRQPDELSAQVAQFLKDHRVEENKFESFDEAEAFFRSCGLRLKWKAEAAEEDLDSIALLRKRWAWPIGHRFRGTTRETWILEAAP